MRRLFSFQRVPRHDNWAEASVAMNPSSSLLSMSPNLQSKVVVAHVGSRPSMCPLHSGNSVAMTTSHRREVEGYRYPNSQIAESLY
jgi:hypothetical protein